MPPPHSYYKTLAIGVGISASLVACIISVPDFSSDTASDAHRVLPADWFIEIAKSTKHTENLNQVNLDYTRSMP